MALPCVAQNQEELYAFQQNHPEISFYELSDYNNLSSVEKKLLGDKVVIYENDILQSNYADLNSTLDLKTNQTLQQENDSFTEVIKVWLANNQDVKIVPQSMYLEGNQAMRDEYLQNDCMILLGELITIEDIKNYQLTH